MNSIYCSNWYGLKCTRKNENVQHRLLFRTDILIILEFCKRLCFISAGKIIILSYETFISVSNKYLNFHNFYKRYLKWFRK